MKENATGAITGAIIEKSGMKQPVKIPIVVVPGLGRNLFSVPQATLQGAITTLAADTSRIETDSFVLSLKQVAGTHDLYSVDVGLDAPKLALQEANINTADSWHCRMLHINAKILDLLNKTNSNRMHFVGSVSDCDVCAIVKNTE